MMDADDDDDDDDGDEERACSANMFRCENGPCIPQELRCNGRTDCPFDTSDELDCNFRLLYCKSRLIFGLFVWCVQLLYT